MRAALVGPVYPYRGGIAQFTTRLALELEAAGHQVKVVSFARQYPSWLYPGKTDKDPSARFEQARAEFILDPLYPWTWARAARAVEDFRPDVVVVQWWTTFWAPAYAALVSALRRRGLPCAFCIHNVLPHEKRFFDAWAARLALSRGSAFITLSPKEEKRLLELLPGMKVYPARLSVFDMNQDLMDRPAARQALGLSPDQPVLLFFGLVRKYKGLDVLLDALAILKSRGIAPLALVSGEFWEDASACLGRVRELGLEDQVLVDNRYIPNEEVPALFSAADAFVAPYTAGSQSAAIKLAMAYGLPVLASRAIASDLPVDRYPILLHETGSAVDLAGSIDAFFSGPMPRREPLSSSQDWEELFAVMRQVSGMG